MTSYARMRREPVVTCPDCGHPRMRSTRYRCHTCLLLKELTYQLRWS